jgi:hypothetical protein
MSMAGCGKRSSSLLSNAISLTLDGAIEVIRTTASLLV